MTKMRYERNELSCFWVEISHKRAPDVVCRRERGLKWRARWLQRHFNTYVIMFDHCGVRTATAGDFYKPCICFPLLTFLFQHQNDVREKIKHHICAHAFDNMLSENPFHGYLVGRLDYRPCAVMPKRFLSANAHKISGTFPRQNHDVFHADMLLSAGSTSHCAAFQSPQGVT